MNSPQLDSIHLKRGDKTLELRYKNGESFSLPFEYLRVYSPSAEVKGHGKGQETLQHGKQFVGIKEIESVGNYAIQLFFDDGHDSGIYSWEYLYELATEQSDRWQDYLQRLEQAQKKRQPEASAQVLHFEPKA